MKITIERNSRPGKLKKKKKPAEKTQGLNLIIEKKK